MNEPDPLPPSPATEPPSQDGVDRLVEASGCLHIARSFRMAIDHRALCIALVALAATICVGSVLDWMYLGFGGGVRHDAIERFLDPSAFDAAADAAPRQSPKEAPESEPPPPMRGDAIKQGAKRDDPPPPRSREEAMARAAEARRARSEPDQTTRPEPDVGGAFGQRAPMNPRADSGAATPETRSPTPANRDGALGNGGSAADDTSPSTRGTGAGDDEAGALGREGPGGDARTTPGRDARATPGGDARATPGRASTAADGNESSDVGGNQSGDAGGNDSNDRDGDESDDGDAAGPDAASAGEPAGDDLASGNEDTAGDAGDRRGVFEVWWAHERAAVLGLLTSSIPGTSIARGSPIEDHFVSNHAHRSPIENLTRLHGGVWWLVRHHPFYFFVFFVCGLAIWCIGGGAICRMTAVRFTRDEVITYKQALAFAWGRREALFFAPCVALAIVAGLAVVITLFGVVIRLPIVDVLSVVLVPLAIGLAGAMTWCLIWLVIGGGLFWPAVAMEGGGAYDALGRTFHYAVNRPWKTMLYAVITLVFAGLSCAFVHLFTYAALWLARTLTGAGSSWLGLWPHAGGSKMEALWPAGADALYAAPTDLSFYEYPAALFVGFWVLIVIGLLWSFIASLFFSANTIVYCLLRRDVDHIDLHEIHWDETHTDDFGLDPPASTPPPPSPPPGDIALPTVEQNARTP